MFFQSLRTCLLFLSSVSFQIASSHAELSTDLDEARDFLANYDARAKVVYYASYLTSWAFNTNITDYNQQKDSEAGLVTAAFEKEAFQNASKFNETGFPDDIKRQFKKLKDIGSAALEPSKVQMYNQLTNDMAEIYGGASVCRPDNPSECLQIEPGLGQIMATSEDWDELLWAWKGFRDEVGVPNKPLYKQYVALANEVARLNGYPDAGEYWRSEYKSDTLIAQAYELYDQILPLYKQLHAYVRRIMNTKHSAHVDLTGRIPSNLLGDMWGRFWGNIYKQVVPYPDAPNIDVTDTLKAKNITVLEMFQWGDDFFASCGLLRVNEAFWDNSLLEKPTDGREVVCHPSAWDMSNGEDFRIRMCTEITMEYFQIVHHELGHIQYYMQYKDLPFLFHGGANRAFHEAVGEVMSLSVSTPAHLSHPDIGLLDAGADFGEETDINFLLKTALNTIGTLPFSLALEQWRWDVFAGNVTEDKWMERWWQLKHDLVGVKAPVTRTEDDFDPGAMFHIVIAYPFLGYFIRTIIQFQFQKALCDAAGHTGPLHRCDFYKSHAAGQKLEDMLKLGSSKPWPDAMEAITGQRLMTTDAINAYFAPLKTWLEETNRENGEKIGWGTEDPTVSPPTPTAGDVANPVPQISLFLLPLCLVATRFIHLRM